MNLIIIKPSFHFAAYHRNVSFDYRASSSVPLPLRMCLQKIYICRNCFSTNTLDNKHNTHNLRSHLRRLFHKRRTCLVIPSDRSPLVIVSQSVSKLNQRNQRVDSVIVFGIIRIVLYIFYKSFVCFQ